MKTIIFDLDGTLLDTLDDLCDSVNYALRTNGMPERSKPEVRRALGNGIRSLMAASVPPGTAEADFETAFLTFRNYYTSHCRLRTQPYAGVPETLHNLRRRGCRMGIVSNKLDPAVKELWRHFFRDTIESAVGESATVRRKPSPDGLLAVLAELGGTPENALYVGDSEVDIETARRAGIPCVSVTWGFRDRDVLVAAGATLLISRPEELEALA